MAQYLRIVSVLCVFFFFYSEPLQGAQITSMTVDQKLVFIDKGITNGFDEQVKVCFFIGNTMLSCGHVVKATLYQAVIKLPEEIDELYARFSKQPDQIRIKKVRSSKKSAAKAENPQAASPPEKRPPRVGLNLFWLPTLSSFSAVSINQMSYDGASSTPSESLWSSSPPASSLVVFALGGEVSLPRIGIALGASYSKYPTGLSAAVYDNPTKGTLNADSTSNGSEFGLYFDYAYAFRPHVSLGLGLEYTAASVTFSTFRNDIAEKEPQLLLYDFAGNLAMIFLRIPLRYEFMFGISRFGLSFGVTPKVKLVTLSTTSNPYADDPLNGSRRKSPEDDFVTALKFAPRTFSMDGQVGLYIAF